MTLEDRLAFREALLDHKDEGDWQDYRPDHRRFYTATFDLDGEAVTGSELIQEYATHFPTDVECSDRAHLNRMLTECDIPQFTFTTPEVLRAFLLSNRPASEWARYEPSYHSFQGFEFQYAGIQVQGQMLLHNCLVELENAANGTHFAFIDYLTQPELKRKLYHDRNAKFVAELFETAGLKVKHCSILDEELTPERLREILLSTMFEDEWTKWEGGSADFLGMRFDLDEYRIFTGFSLRRRYEEFQGRKVNTKQIFDDVGLSVASDPDLLRKRLENHLERFYGLFDNPDRVRELLLQVRSEGEWRTPQTFGTLRGERIAIDGGRKVTIHSLLHLYSVHKYNAQQDDVDERIFCQDAQEKSGIIQSNKTALGELLDFAGLEYRFVPSVTEVELDDPHLLRRMLLNGTLKGDRVTVRQLNDLPSYKLRGAKFTDPRTGLSLKGHSLMLFYSALPYVKEHDIGLEEAVNTLHQGKSNQTVMNEILEIAKLKD